jgi:hypothetical protein
MLMFITLPHGSNSSGINDIRETTLRRIEPILRGSPRSIPPLKGIKSTIRLFTLFLGTQFARRARPNNRALNRRETVHCQRSREFIQRSRIPQELRRRVELISRSVLFFVKMFRGRRCLLGVKDVDIAVSVPVLMRLVCGNGQVWTGVHDGLAQVDMFPALHVFVIEGFEVLD